MVGEKGCQSHTDLTSDTYESKMTIEIKFTVAPQKVSLVNLTSIELQLEKHSLSPDTAWL